MSAGLLPVLNVNEAYKAMAETHPALMIADFADPEAAADALTEAFERLEADDLSLRQELLQDARAYAWNEVAQRYMDVYAETLTPRGKSPQLLRQRGQAA